MTEPITTPADDHVFLIGRPPLGEFLAFMKTLAIGGQSADQGGLAEEWRHANDRVVELEESEGGWADDAVIEPLPDGFGAMAEAVYADPFFQQAYRFVPSRVGIVELDRLVVFQKQINLAYVDVLKNRIGSDPSLADLFEVALPSQRTVPSVQVAQTAQNAFTFVSPSNDFRFLDASLVEPRQVVDHAFPGPPTAILGLAVGYGSNYLNALHVEGRLILNNGSHRAYAMRELGIKKAPCLIQSVSRRDELELLQQEVFKNPERYLTAARPPLLKDYFDSDLRKVVPVARKNRTVKLSFGVEVNDTPG